MSYQQIVILGRSGNDCELRFTPSGTAVASFRFASNEKWTDGSGQKQERVIWYKVTLWGKAAESLSEYITKGKELMVIGTVTASAYMDKQGKPAASLDVKADQIRFAGSKGGSSTDPTDSINTPDEEPMPF